MKKTTMAAIGAWLVAGAMTALLGSAMQEPKAQAAPKAVETQEAVGPEHAPPAPPAADETPEEFPITVAAARPRPAHAAPRGCRVHTLVQGGSPTAPTVLACD